VLARTGEDGGHRQRALKAEGWTVVRAHPFDKAKGHGFIDSQKMGMEVFRRLDPDAPLIVAECVCNTAPRPARSAHHRGRSSPWPTGAAPWPGLVGMLNLNGS